MLQPRNLMGFFIAKMLQMAKDKKSFILYSDSIHTIEKLSDVDAGLLLKHLMRYVNDLNPTTDNALVEIAFEPIKQQLKRDLVKFEDVKVKRSEAGKAGANKRWQMLSNDNKPKQSIAKIAVNDNVNVNDINIKVLEERKQKFAASLKPYLDNYGKKMLNEFYAYWTEHGPTDRKMRFEKEKAFGIERRLINWDKNKNKFNNFSDDTEPKELEILKRYAKK